MQITKTFEHRVKQFKQVLYLNSILDPLKYTVQLNCFMNQINTVLVLYKNSKSVVICRATDKFYYTTEISEFIIAIHFSLPSFPLRFTKIICPQNVRDS